MSTQLLLLLLLPPLLTKSLVVIENIAKRATAEIATRELRALGYSAAAFFANSASFGVPQSRTRLYILGVDPDQCEILDGPEQWAEWMEVLCHQIV